MEYVSLCASENGHRKEMVNIVVGYGRGIKEESDRKQDRHASDGTISQRTRSDATGAANNVVSGE